MKTTRQVIVHYHTFKNSGSSFDELLRENYGDRHIQFDGPFSYSLFHQPELAKIIKRNSQAIAFSSHSIRLPVPSSLWENVLAVVFVRHPILRAKSVFEFSKKNGYHNQKNGNLNYNRVEQWAVQENFDGWVSKMREASDLHLLSNSQTQMFSGVHGASGLSRMVENGSGSQIRISDLWQAKRNLSSVPLLARTELFEEDVSRFPTILDDLGLDFKFTRRRAANVTSSTLGDPVEQRVTAVLKELSPTNKRWLIEANKQDLDLYDYTTALLNNR